MIQRSIIEVVKIIIALVALGSLVTYLLQDFLIFQPQSLSEMSRAKLVDHQRVWQREDVSLHGWLIKGEITKEQPLIVYYGGNAEEISGNLWTLDSFQTESFLFVNYRGFGNSTGKPSEKALFEDALFLFDEMVEKEGIDPLNIILMGRSLGSAMAIYVASQRQAGGVILVTGFDSMTNVGKHYYPFIPIKLLLKHKFDSATRASEIDLPSLHIIAEYDEVIPNTNSIDLFLSWSGPAEKVIIKKAGHNDINQYDDYWTAINSFLRSHSQL